MPYAIHHDLPARVRDHLPNRAQYIFRQAFNHAWEEYADIARREEVAFGVAWSAIKKSCESTDAGGVRRRHLWRSLVPW